MKRHNLGAFRPENSIVFGGGYVAMELAWMFARPGSRVTPLQRSSHIFPNISEDIGKALAGYLEEEGIEMAIDLEISSVTASDGGRITATIRHCNKVWTFTASKIFVPLAAALTPHMCQRSRSSHLIHHMVDSSF